MSVVLATLLCTGVAIACSKPAPTPWKIDISSVVGRDITPTDSMRMAVYLDGTVSMGGYAVPGGEYGRFLEELESISQTAWKRADIHYYKFGGSVREIKRQEFLGARSPSFYHEPGLSGVTSIEKAIGCHPGPNVDIIITDLFQSEGDVNTVVEQIKKQCFQQGVTVGILGIASRFDGTVYDAKVPPYRFTSRADQASLRPFFALMFGDASALDRLVSSLSSLSFIDTKKFSTIGPNIVSSYTVKIAKPRANKTVNLNAPKGPYEFSLDLRKGESGGQLLDTILIRPRHGAMPIHADQMELVVFERTLKGKAWSDSSVSSDFTLTTGGVNDTVVGSALDVNIPGTSGRYSYALMLRTGAINGFESPAWIRAWSSDNPTPQSDANKTLNLNRFILALRRAASSVTQPAIAKWYVNVRKQ